MKPITRSVLLALLFGFASATRADDSSPQIQLSVSDQRSAGAFNLVDGKQAAPILVDSNDFRVVQIAADCLASDIKLVTGVKPSVWRGDESRSLDFAVIAGTLGKSALIDALAQAGKLDVKTIRGQWESFIIATVTNPAPGIRLGLVIAGSNRRGTAYGIFTLSEAIGVSPWYWWADVTPRHREALIVRAGSQTQGPPAVKYRGIFINDEDWGMQPWAAKTFEPEAKDIGPKTYTKIFELLLRLKANYMWPAMHNCTKAFNLFPENKIVADDYAIVMGSSHCEPMLRNNVGEWPTNAADQWNYQSNRDGVRQYWEERVKENGQYENVFTIGMRGVHDGPLVAKGTAQEKVSLVEQIFADQREMLVRLVNSNVMQVPQAFVPYKEVMKIYQDGLKVPDDVTLVWVDDNHGYIRRLSTPEEQKRKGGAGVYYHVSYWGAPQDYLWLCSTPPALIGYEMGKALDYGARTLWVLNVGDLKPAEIDIEYFLRLAWTGKAPTQREFLTSWAERNFGSAHAADIAGILGEYYRLNYAMKPEHLNAAEFNDEESAQRLERFARLAQKADALYAGLSPESKDGFYELVVYPVRCSALMNEKILTAACSRLLAAQGDASANDYADKAQKAHAQIKVETNFYNTKLADGKWRYMMSSAPHRLAVAQMPEVGRVPSATNSPPTVKPSAAPASPELQAARSFVESNGYVSMLAEHFTRNIEQRGASWRVIEGLGRAGNDVAVFPTTVPSVEKPDDLAANAPRLEYDFSAVHSGKATVTLYCVPTHRIHPGRGLRYAVAIDGEPPKMVDIESEEYSKTWSTNVLRAVALGVSEHNISATGAHTLKVWMVDPGIVFDKIVVDLGGMKKSYFGPAETPAVKE